jgi:hypothetical protein
MAHKVVASLPNFAGVTEPLKRMLVQSLAPTATFGTLSTHPTLTGLHTAQRAGPCLLSNLLTKRRLLLKISLLLTDQSLLG